MKVAQDGFYTVRFANPAAFLQAFHHDIANGGLFVPTGEEPPLDQMVMIELVFEWNGRSMVFPARVVHHQPGAGGLTLLAAHDSSPASARALARARRARCRRAFTVPTGIPRTPLISR